MPTTIKEKIITEIEDLPDNKVLSLMDYIHFLKWEEDSFSTEEIKQIKDADREAKSEPGTNWRNVRDDV